jgi:antitoxin StbD
VRSSRKSPVVQLSVWLSSKTINPAAVIINVQAYQEMLDELENLRIEAAARERLINFDPAQAVSHDDMRARYARKD